MTKQPFGSPSLRQGTAILDYNNPLELTRRLENERVLSEQMGGTGV
jgi:hypothetical protein